MGKLIEKAGARLTKRHTAEEVEDLDPAVAPARTGAVGVSATVPRADAALAATTQPIRFGSTLNSVVQMASADSFKGANGHDHSPKGGSWGKNQITDSGDGSGRHQTSLAARADAAAKAARARQAAEQAQAAHAAALAAEAAAQAAAQAAAAEAAEAAARAEEAEREAEAARLAEAARQARAARIAQAHRDAEVARLLEAEHATEVARVSEAVRIAEAARQAQADRAVQAAREAEAAAALEAQLASELIQVAESLRTAQAEHGMAQERMTHAMRALQVLQDAHAQTPDVRDFSAALTQFDMAAREAAAREVTVREAARPASQSNCETPPTPAAAAAATAPINPMEAPTMNPSGDPTEIPARTPTETPPVTVQTLVASLSHVPLGANSRMVELDLTALVQRGFIARPDQVGTVVDQFRVIKRPLINNALGRGVPRVPHGNLIMVTSAMPGEGKSFTSINLALSIASEIDSTVLLVDADVSKPSVAASLGINSGPGLMDVLMGRCAMHEAILRTNIPKLAVMQAGYPQDQATEMLSSAAMDKLLEEMATRYSDRVIIFDLPPLLPTTEARVLAGHAGQLVMVVSSNMTTEAQLRDAIATVEPVPVKLMVLNRATSGGHAEHGYGYTYSRRVETPRQRDETEPAFAFNRTEPSTDDGEPWAYDDRAEHRSGDGQKARSRSLLGRLFTRRSDSSPVA